MLGVPATNRVALQIAPPRCNIAHKCSGALVEVQCLHTGSRHMEGHWLPSPLSHLQSSTHCIEEHPPFRCCKVSIATSVGWSDMSVCCGKGCREHTASHYNQDARDPLCGWTCASPSRRSTQCQHSAAKKLHRQGREPLLTCIHTPPPTNAVGGTA